MLDDVSLNFIAIDVDIFEGLRYARCGLDVSLNLCVLRNEKEITRTHF